MINQKITDNNDTIRWYKPGTNILHREDGPAVELSNGNKCWYKNGLRHREDVPAIEYNWGDKHWYKEGKLHREDGPAIEYNDGYKEYWLDGIRYFYSEWLAILNPKLKAFI